MDNINFQPIFDYIDNKIRELKEELPSKTDFQNLQNAVVDLAHRFDKVDQKSTVNDYRLNRVENWGLKLLKKQIFPMTGKRIF